MIRLAKRWTFVSRTRLSPSAGCYRMLRTT